jgi:hypothetical protein
MIWITQKTPRQTVLLLLRVFIATGTCLPSRCLATLGGRARQGDIISLFSLLSYFEKISRLMRSRCCVCVSVYPIIVARQRLGRNVTAVTNIQATIQELLDTSFSM